MSGGGPEQVDALLAAVKSAASKAEVDKAVENLLAACREGVSRPLERPRLLETFRELVDDGDEPLPAGLRTELQRLVADPNPPEGRVRHAEQSLLAYYLEKLGPKRKPLAELLRSCFGSISDEQAGYFKLLWHSESPETVADARRLTGELPEATAALKKWIADQRADLKRLADENPSLEGPLGARIREALKGDDDAEMLATIEEVRRFLGPRPDAGQEKAIAAARERLTAVVARVREEVAGGVLTDPEKEQLSAAIEEAEQLSNALGEPSEGGYAGGAEAIEAAATALEAVLTESLETRKRQREFIDELIPRVQAAIAASEPRDGDAKFESRLRETASPDRFWSIAGMALERTSGESPDGPDTSAIDRGIEELESALKQHADAVPTAALVEGRDLIDRIRADVAGGLSGVELKGRAGELSAVARQLGQTAEAARAESRERESAKAHGLLGELEPLSAVADGAEAKRLESLRSAIQSDPSSGEAARRLHAERIRIGRRLRTDADAALRASRGSKGPDVQAKRQAVEKAMGGESLSALAKATAELAAAAPARNLPKILAAVGFVVVVAAVPLIARQLGKESSREYELSLAAGVSGAHELKLVRAGEVVESSTLQSGTPVRFKLVPGRYDIYLDDRFTGRAIRSPADDRALEPLIVP